MKRNPIVTFLKQSKRIAGHCIHVLCWVAIVMVALVVMAFVWLSYGIPGEWVQGFLDDSVPMEAGRASIDWISYRPGKGLVVEGFCLHDADHGRVLAQFSKAKVKVSLLNFRPLSERIKSIEVDDLFIAQIVPSEDLDDPRDCFQPRPPAIDFAAFAFELSPISVEINRLEVLDIRAEHVTTTVKATEGHIYINDISAEIDSISSVKGSTVVDFNQRVVDISLVGSLQHQQLNGIYRVIDFPLIETYSNQFHIPAPSYGDAKIRVGLDKYENIFDLDVQINVSTPSDYCGVAFDEASATIESNGVWDTITHIDDMVAHRNGDAVARGSLTFDCPGDRFMFSADSEGLTPAECYQLIDMPFTQYLPPIVCDVLPTLHLSGELPLLTRQTPDRVVLRDGYFRSNGPCTVYKDYHAEAVEMNFAMLRGTFLIPEISVDVGPNKEEHLDGSVEVTLSERGDYVDIHAEVATDGLSLKYVTPTLVEKLGDDASCIGVAELYCRTDETFAATLWANLDLKVTGEKLMRFNFFSVMTDFFANNIPGLSRLTDANEIYAKGTIRNGVLNLSRFRLEGSLLSIEGLGRYNLVTDVIKGTLIIGFINEDSYVGMATRTVFLPIARAMWRVNLGGTLKEPTWDLESIVGTVSDFITGETSQLEELEKEVFEEDEDRSENESEKTEGAFTDLFFEEE
jgi:hypothetical protein